MASTLGEALSWMPTNWRWKWVNNLDEIFHRNWMKCFEYLPEMLFAQYSTSFYQAFVYFHTWTVAFERHTDIFMIISFYSLHWFGTHFKKTDANRELSESKCLQNAQQQERCKRGQHLLFIWIWTYEIGVTLKTGCDTFMRVSKPLCILWRQSNLLTNAAEHENCYEHRDADPK